MTSKIILSSKKNVQRLFPSNEILNNRPNTKTEIKNLFLAGDWVNTCLPSTIESAVKSGRIAAEVIVTIKDLNRLRSE